MDTVVECETATDYVATARLKTEAFALPGMKFDAEPMRWFYERSFSQGSTVIALRDGDRKVGQVAMTRQTVMVDGQPESAAQIVDLFILPAFRKSANVRKLYGEAARQFEEQGIRFAIGMPNAKAISVNSHFFKLMPFLKLPLQMGVALPFLAPADVVSLRFSSQTKAQCTTIFADYGTPASENGLPWTPNKLAERLSGRERQYGVHVTDEVLLISSPRESRGIPYTLLAGFFARTGTRASAGAVAHVVRAASAMWHRPIYAYAGINAAITELPGYTMPIRPSPLLLQLRDFKPSRKPLRLDRFQLLDFDFG